MFTQESFGPISSHGNSNMPNIWTYRTTDAFDEVVASGYFAKKYPVINDGDTVNIDCSDRSFTGVFLFDGTDYAIVDIDFEYLTARGEWSSSNTPYPKNSLVKQNGWNGVSLVDTSDNLAPERKGAQTDVYLGSIGTDSVSAKQVIFGQRYTLPEAIFLDGYRIFTVTGNFYQLYTIVDPNGSREIRPLVSFEATVTGWTSTTIIPQVIGAGVEFDLIAIANEPDPTPTITNIDYDYLTPNNPGVPLSGQILHSNQLPSVMSISKTDVNTVDQSSFLATLTVGDIIDGVGVRWAIQAIQDQGTYLDITVAPTQQGAPDGNATFAFETVTPTPITFGYDADWWDNEGITNVRGLLSTDGLDSVVESGDAFGTDILIQFATFSEDWDLYGAAQGFVSGDSGTYQLAAPSGQASVALDNGTWANSAQFGGVPVYSYTEAAIAAPGLILLNNSDLSLVTKVTVSKIASNGADGSLLFEKLRGFDVLSVSDYLDNNNFMLATVTGEPEETANAFEIPVEVTSSGGALTVGELTNFVLQPTSPRAEVVQVDRLLDMESSTSSQSPTGTGPSNAIRIEFGAAAGTVSDPVMVDSTGLMTVNQGGLYRIKLGLQYGRSGAAGVSHLLFGAFVNGVQAGRSVVVFIANANSDVYIENDNWVNVPAGATIEYKVMRDADGNDSGGLVGFDPTVDGGDEWNPAPSAALRVERLVSCDGVGGVCF